MFSRDRCGLSFMIVVKFDARYSTSSWTSLENSLAPIQLPLTQWRMRGPLLWHFVSLSPRNVLSYFSTITIFARWRSNVVAFVYSNGKIFCYRRINQSINQSYRSGGVAVYLRDVICFALLRSEWQAIRLSIEQTSKGSLWIWGYRRRQQMNRRLGGNVML